MAQTATRIVNGQVTEGNEELTEGVVFGEAGDPNAADEMFSSSDGKVTDGTIWLPKITTTTIKSRPERCKIDERRMKICSFAGIATGMRQMSDPKTGEIFHGLTSGDEPFGAIVYGDDGQPDAVYKSDTLFFPIAHQAALNAVEKHGVLRFAVEFWSQPAGNPLGYSWFYRNLATIDPSNPSLIDRLLRLTVQAGHRIAAQPHSGLLADLRRAS